MHDSIRTRATARLEIPVQFSRLRDMAYNFWWSWTPDARALFRRMDATCWARYRNPIELLIDLEPERWHELQNDAEFIRAYRGVVEQFDAYLVPDGPTWYQRNGAEDRGPIAYFSTEFGWHECLQIYSGGLGVLSGDHSKSASDLGLPFVGVGLMYRLGYFRQTVAADGQQQHFYPDHDLHRLPILPATAPGGGDLQVTVDMPGRTLHLKVWVAMVGRVPVLLLDTDIPANHPADRPITSVLYISGREMRLCQEIVLGVGGVAALKALGIRPAVWHINEGHSALLGPARIRDLMRERGLSHDEALSITADSTLFTTHTPVPAGNEAFDIDLVRPYLATLTDGLGIPVERWLELGHDGNGGEFNMTALALRLSHRANGVSRLHGEVADGMWRHLLDDRDDDKIEAVTNGVHVPTWLGPEVGKLLRAHLGPDLGSRLDDAEFSRRVHAIPDVDLWNAHNAQKGRLIGLVRDRLRAQLARHGRSPGELRTLDRLFDPDVLLVGFARRFATYKRADLLLRDYERIRQIINDSERPVQFLFAGKAHPADKPGQELIRRIWEAGLDGGMGGRIQFLENYDMRTGRNLVQGVDLWLNNPLRPLEASGTSGMKAAVNGGLNCSVFDGWWCEGYDASHGWRIGDPEASREGHEQDGADAEALYRVLVDGVLPAYYQRDADGVPREWLGRMKSAIATLSLRFGSDRMVREYAERYYLQATNRAAETTS